MHSKQAGYPIRAEQNGENKDQEPILFLSGTVVRDTGSALKVTGMETHVRPRHNGVLNGWVRGRITYDGADTIRICADKEYIRFRVKDARVFCQVNSKHEVEIDGESAEIVRDVMEQARPDKPQPIVRIHKR